MSSPEKTNEVTTVIKIKLGACLTSPSKRGAADLHHALMQCNRISTATARAWLRWREDNPEWQPDRTKTKQRDTPAYPYELRSQLYHDVAVPLAPELSSQLVQPAGDAALEHLLARMPKTHGGTRGLFRHQAVMLNEVNLDTFRGNSFMVKGAVTRLQYQSAGMRADPAGRAGTAKDVGLAGRDSCVLSFPLYGSQSGRSQRGRNPIWRLAIGRLSKGHRRIIKQVASGEYTLCDSKIVWHPGEKCKQDKKTKGRKTPGGSTARRNKSTGAWYWHMTCKIPAEPLGLDKSRMAELVTSDRESNRPFRISIGQSKWDLGDQVLGREYKRLDERRIAIRARHEALSGRTGHGRLKSEMIGRKTTRKVRALVNSFTDRLVAEIVRFCQRYDCGSVTYHEPKGGGRMCGWFGTRNVPYDWTSFRAQLTHKCNMHDIDLTVVREKPQRQRVAARTGN